MPSAMQKPYVGKECPECRVGRFKVPNNGQEWHVECDYCDTVLLTYDPMPHQAAFHADPHKYRMLAGGYGSAKTSTACAEIIKHILETPNGMTLIGAATLPQLEQTAEKQFFEMMPESLILHHSKQKKIVDMKNGHRVLFRPLDDEGKARSLNLSAFWIEEASEVEFEYFVQLTTRLRNHATDRHIGILSTNPDMNWIKSEFLLKADAIHNAEEDYHQIPEEINPNYSVHIAPTSWNIHLPPTYYEDTAKGRPQWWIDRYLHASFKNAEGLVYPMADEYVVEPFDIPDHWQRGFAMDFGLRHPTAALWAAIDPETGIVYLYDEHYQNEKGVAFHAAALNERFLNMKPGVLRFMVGDPKGDTKDEKDMRSLFDHYAEYGIFLTRATNRIEDGIMKVYNYFELGKIRIFSTLKWFLWEIRKYKYPDVKLDSKRDGPEKPLDKDDHLMDALKYLIAELPDDPSQLINKSYNPLDTRVPLPQYNLPHALQDTGTESYGNDWSNYY